MNKIGIFTLKALRKLYRTLFDTNKKLDCIEDAEIASGLIVQQLMSNEPCMIARFGGFEMSTIINYLGVKKEKINFLEYIKGNEPDPLWNPSLINYMNTNAGFFPPTIEKIEQFCELMLEDKKYVDILGSWLAEDRYLTHDMDAHKIALRYLEPFYTEIPWTKMLEGKKVLVVHPFAQTIASQYEKRHLLFKNPNTLPIFASLTVIKAVQSIGGADKRFNDWFEALEYMKSQIDQVDYDVCLIGAGAYGFPLAAHVKRMGKKGLHIGGSLQLFFGIRGNRWDNPNYATWWGVPEGFYSNMVNEHWVRPDESDKPKNAQQVEGATYW